MTFKRLVVLSDGTWQTLENPIPTNIQHLTLATAREDDDGVQQIIVYDAGVGTDENPWDKLLGGALGAGIDLNIKQLYTFLALNYEDGDEIYMFGFSRGAYTVRSLNGMIYKAGLTRRSEVQWIREAYELYRKPIEANSEEAVSFRTAHGERVPVKLLACFDTVGSLGLPDMGPLFDKRRYQFHDTKLNNTTEHAIHMLSIDEDRKSFEPTIMEESPDKPGQLSQLYFWGGHGGIGGGDSRQEECAKATLHYLLDEMQRRGLGLKIDRDLVPSGYDGNVDVPKLGGGLDGLIRVVTGRKVREINSIDELHETAIDRFCAKSDWRPDALKKIGQVLLTLKASREHKAESSSSSDETEGIPLKPEGELDRGARELPPLGESAGVHVGETAKDDPSEEEETGEEPVEEDALVEKANGEELIEAEVVKETAADEQPAEESSREVVVEQEEAEGKEADEEVAEESAAGEEAVQNEAAEEETVQEDAVEIETAEEEDAEEETTEKEVAEETVAEEEAVEEEAVEHEVAEEEAAEDGTEEEEAAAEEEAATEEAEAEEQAVTEDAEAEEEAATEEAEAEKEAAAEDAEADEEVGAEEEAPKEETVEQEKVDEETAKEDPAAEPTAEQG